MFNLESLKKLSNIVEIKGPFVNGQMELCSDSRNYKSGEVFFCIKGDHFNGFKFAEEVIEKGCKVIVFELSEEVEEKYKCLVESQKSVCFVQVKKFNSGPSKFGKTKNRGMAKKTSLFWP